MPIKLSMSDALMIGVPVLLSACNATAAALDDCVAAYDRQDYVLALLLCRPLAEQGDPRAQDKLGLMYWRGHGPRGGSAEELGEAANWFFRAANQGDAQAQFDAGRALAVTENFAEAAKWFRKAADQGHAQAQIYLGAMYHDGQGVGKDYVEAAKWYRMAADQGSVEAQVNLAQMYVGGEGVRKDDAEAAKWFGKAADQGDVQAQLKLGLMYEVGRGIPQDYVLAHMWLNLAASKGDPQAETFRETIASKMTPAQVAEAQRLAREWKPTK